jgi:hypothetical protein
MLNLMKGSAVTGGASGGPWIVNGADAKSMATGTNNEGRRRRGHELGLLLWGRQDIGDLGAGAEQRVSEPGLRDPRGREHRLPGGLGLRQRCRDVEAAEQGDVHFVFLS